MIDAFLFVSNPKLQPVQLILRNILAVSMVNINNSKGSHMNYTLSPPRAIQNATIEISTLPIVFIYPFLQKYFVKGIMVGSVKG